MFQPIYRYFRKIGKIVHISAWESKGLPDESIILHATSYNGFAPLLNYTGVRPRIKFYGQCLKKDKLTFTHKSLLNIFIVYEIHLWSYTQCANFALGSSLF